MKPTVKPKYPNERESVGQRKRGRPERPWRLEYQWKSKRMWKESKAIFRGTYEESWQEFGWNKYVDLNHAAQQLAKDVRSDYSRNRHKSMYNERNVRVRNIETGEIHEVVYHDDKIWIKECALVTEQLENQQTTP